MSRFGEDEGLVHEALVTSREVCGDSVQDFWATLAHRKDVFQKVFALVLSLIKVVFQLRPTFDRDMLKEGWKELEKDSPTQEGEFIPELEEIVTSKDEGRDISGEEFERRIKGRGDLVGQRQLEAMLREQERIPVEWRKFSLTASETVWVSPDGDRDVACLDWDGRQWVLNFLCLGGDFDSNYRLVRLSKLSS